MQQESKIVISGASGFIGTALVPFLEEQGHAVYRLVRRSPSSDREIQWNPGSELDPEALPAGLRVVINLSGSSIAVRFTEQNRQEILNSRISSTGTLVRAVQAMENPPELFINASGIGYYGDRRADLLTESSSPGNDFVADVCRRWENALSPLKDVQTRTIALRTGIVLDPYGGALEKMLPAFKTGLGAVLGDGRQYMSWISLRDYLAVIRHAINTPKLAGPINAVAPEAVTNREFSQQLAQALGRGLFFSAPAWALTTAMGEMARLLLLASQRVQPEALEQSGFHWQDRSLSRTFAEFFSH